MRKIYVLDTSVLIYNPNAFKQFPNSDVVIPIAVLDELDKLKKQSNEAGKNARVAIRLLDEVSNNGDISTGILIDDDIILKIDAAYIDLSQSPYLGLGDPFYGDTKILACAQSIWHTHKSHDVVLVSNDINLRVKAKSRGIEAQSHEGDKTSISDLYMGTHIIANEEAGLELQKNGSIDPEQYGFDLLPNECVLFESDNGDEISLGRKIAYNKIKLIRKSYPWNLSSRNPQQAFAIDLLMDKNVDLVTLIGRAGTGKSLVVLASALELVLGKREFSKFIIYRPIQPVGNDIGYLPGPQPLDAKIATPYGWTTMGELKPNDFIIGSDGFPKKIIKTFEKGEKEVFRVIFNDGSFTECCEDHLWYTTTIKESQRKYGVGSVKSLKEIRKTIKTYKTQINNHKIPMVKPVQLQEKETIIDPYIMGILLGDGTLSEDDSVYFTTSDNEIVENCQAALPRGMICKSKSKTSKACNFAFINESNVGRKHRENNIINSEISRLGLRGKKSSTKFIPDIYKFNSVKNRISLLQGMMDADGFISEDGSDIIYYTISDTMADDFKYLIQSLGGKAHINKKNVKYKFDDQEEKEVICNVISLSLPPKICPVRLSRKVSRFKPRKYELSRMISDIVSVGKKETRCIMVDSEDHLYATDQFILTHNTMEEKLAPWFQPIMDNFEVLFDTKGNGDWKKELELFQRKGKIEMEAITYIRGRSIPNAIILIDECQNLSKEEVKTILTRAGENTKIILTGDIDQIDNRDLDATSNGLTYVIEKFKDSVFAGHVTFTQGERSRLATIAADIL